MRDRSWNMWVGGYASIFFTNPQLRITGPVGVRCCAEKLWDFTWRLKGMNWLLQRMEGRGFGCRAIHSAWAVWKMHISNMIYNNVIMKQDLFYFCTFSRSECECFVVAYTYVNIFNKSMISPSWSCHKTPSTPSFSGRKVKSLKQLYLKILNIGNISANRSMNAFKINIQAHAHCKFLSTVCQHMHSCLKLLHLIPITSENVHFNN